MIQTAALIGLWMVTISVALCIYRLFRGPTTADRVIAADTIATNLLAIIALSAIRTGEKLFIIAVLTLAILSFIGTVVYAKFLERGKVID